METLILPTTTKPKTKVKREKSTSTVGHYVRNADLIPAILEAKELGRVTDKLMGMIRKIAEGYSRKSWFVGYSFREDMVSAAVENLVKNALKFDHVRYNNPFAFYTTAVHRSFLQFLADEKKHRNIRDKLRMDAGANPSFNFMEEERDERDFEIQESDDHYVESLKDDSDSDVSEKVVEEDKRDGTEVPREEKVRFASRAPGALRKYGPGDFDIDPVTGAISIKPEAIARYEKLETAVVEVEDPPKKKRAPRKTTPEKEVVYADINPPAINFKKAKEKLETKKKDTAKSTPAKRKTTAIPEEKLKPLARAKKEVAKKPAAKKTVEKKVPAKKVAAKKVAAKKTTKSAKG